MAKSAKFYVVVGIVIGSIFGVAANHSLMNTSSAQSTSESEIGRYRTEKIGEYNVLLVDTKTGKCWSKSFSAYKPGAGGWREESPDWAAKVTTQ